MAIQHITDSDSAAKQIMDAMERAPLAVEVLQEFGRTGSFIAALAKFYTPEEYQEEFEALTEGSPAYQAKQATISDRKAKKEKEAERKNAFESSQKTYDKWVEEKGLSDEEQELFEEEIKRFALIFEDGKLTEPSWISFGRCTTWKTS